jgi:hypothetical protein
MTAPMSRRAALRGLGVSVALPWLDAMTARAAAPVRPKRAAFVYMPNGVRLDHWFPTTAGADFDLPPTLAPLAKVRQDITVLGGLDRTFVAGTGVHAQCGACWLTSSPPTAPRDGGFPTDTSLDQLLARRLGADTALPSLELSCNDHPDNKETKYFESVSWYGPGYAAAVEKNPRAVFRRLFGGTHTPADASVLDAVRDGAASLRGRLGAADRGKLDEYLESVRGVERRVRAAETLDRPPGPEPAGVPAHRGEYIRLMCDLVVLAFRTDRTRVATLVIDPERWDSPRSYHGVFDKPQNHHVLTHTKGEAARDAVGRIDRFHVEQYAYLLERLKAVPDGDGTLLDQSAVVLGSGISDGDRHSYKDLPVVVGGRAGGALRTGFYRPYPGERPLADLWLTLLQAFGADAPRFADSGGVLAELLG